MPNIEIYWMERRGNKNKLCEALLKPSPEYISFNSHKIIIFLIFSVIWSLNKNVYTNGTKNIENSKIECNLSEKMMH